MRKIKSHDSDIEIRNAISHAYGRRHEIDDSASLETIFSDTRYELGKDGSSIFQFNLRLKAKKTILNRSKIHFPVFLPLPSLYFGKKVEVPEVEIVRFEAKRKDIKTHEEPINKPIEKNSQDDCQKENESEFYFDLVNYLFPLYFSNTLRKDTEFQIFIRIHVKNYAPNTCSTFSLKNFFSSIIKSYDLFWFFAFQKSNYAKVSNLEFNYPERSHFIIKGVQVLHKSENVSEWKNETSKWTKFDSKYSGILFVKEGMIKEVFILARCTYIPEWFFWVSGIVLYASVLNIIAIASNELVLFKLLSIVGVSGKIVLMLLWSLGFFLISSRLWKKYLP